MNKKKKNLLMALAQMYCKTFRYIYMYIYFLRRRGDREGSFGGPENDSPSPSKTNQWSKKKKIIKKEEKKLFKNNF